jgi:hypothetical protein
LSDNNQLFTGNTKKFLEGRWRKTVIQSKN